MSSTPTYRLAEGALCVSLEQEAIILSLSAGKYFGVKGAMGYLIEDLRGGLTLAEMVERTCARFEVEPARASRDLQQILPRLIAAGIVEAATDDPNRMAAA